MNIYIKALIVIFSLFNFINLQAQQTNISIRFTNAGLQQKILTLYQASGYRESINLTTDGTFKANLPNIEPGLYFMEEVGEIYLAPDYQLQITVDKKGQKIFKGKGADENKKLYSSRKNFSKFIPSTDEGLLFKAYAMDVPDFISQINNYHKSIAQQVKGMNDDLFRSTLIKEGNFKTSIALQDYRIRYGVDSVKRAEFLHFIDTIDRDAVNANARIDSASKTTRSKYLTDAESKQLDSLTYAVLQLNDVQSFNQSYAYRDLLESWMINQIHKSGIIGREGIESMQSARIYIANNYLDDPVIGGYYRYKLIGDHFKMVKDEDEAEKLYTGFMSNPTNKSYYPKMQAIYNKRVAIREGQPSPTFNFENMEGGFSNLSDLKGKYVYIDVWATWCGPCKMEIPHLTKLEQELHGKNITFVSLSLDDQKDKKKWKDYVTNENLGGIQLISDNAFETDFVQHYNINAIPRFILLNPQGNIISSNADRPSDPQLKEKLLKLLK